MGKINKKKGITIAILVATVVVLLIIVSAITVSYVGMKETTRKREFAKELYTIGNLVEKYRFEKGKYPDMGEFTLDLGSIQTASKKQFETEPTYTANTVVLSKLDLSVMDVETVSRGVQKKGDTDLYAVSRTTGNVYYIAGEKIGDTVYYTLTDELRTLLDLPVVSEVQVPTAEYAKNGLLLQYDAINNTGTGHSNTTALWKDLSGNGNDGQLQNFNYNAASGWNGNYLTCDGVDDIVASVKALDYKNSKELTVEIVMTNLEKKNLSSLIVESSENSNVNYGSFYIDSQEYGTQDITLAMKFNNATTQIKNHKMVDGLMTIGKTANYAVTFNSAKPYNEYTRFYCNGGANTAVSVNHSNSELTNDVSNLTLSNYKFYIASRSGVPKISTKMNVLAVRVYNRALTEEELVKNYEIDKVKYGI